MSAVIERRDIPATWQLVPLKELGEWSGGGTPSKAKPEYWTNGKIPWVSPKDMKTERITDSEDHITKAAVEESTAKLIAAGSVLVVTRSGILSRTLPVAVTTLPVTVNQDLKAITPKDGVLPEYVAWALRCFAREILNTCSKQGTTVSSIETAALHRFEIPIAPLDQQKRIVEEIEKQFSRLDEAVANLKRVKANLKRYKAAVLKAAVEGRLVKTEAEIARREGRAYETADELLSKIQPDLVSAKRAGRLWGSGHVPALTEEEQENLPEGWAWVKVRDLGDSPESTVQVGPMSMKSSEFTAGGVPVLNVGCVQWGEFDESKLDYLPRDLARNFERYRIRPGDVLFTRSGTVGRCAVAKDHQSDWLMTFHLLRVRPNQAKCLPEYLRAVFEGASHIRRQTREASIGSTRAGFNTNLLAMLDVPLPPMIEQQRIMDEVERRLSLVSEFEGQVGANLRRSDRLRSSILEQEFSGSLGNIQVTEKEAENGR